MTSRIVIPRGLEHAFAGMQNARAIMSFDPDNPPEGLFVYRSHVPFDHIDMQGVLHHSRHFLHVEAASHAFFLHVMEVAGFEPERYPDQNGVVRHMSIDYLRPLYGVRDIIVTLRVVRLRACSMSVAFELRSADGSELFSKGEREVCRVKHGELRPSMWSEQYRERFSRWLDAANNAAQ